MDFQELYKSKRVTAEEILDKVESNDEIIVAMAASEPVHLLEKLHTIAGRVENVNVVSCLPMKGYDFFMKPEMKGHFFMESWFYSADLRKAHAFGTVSYIPNHLHLAATKRLAYRKPRFFWGTASPMDRYGNMTLSLGITYEKDILENAGIVVLEVNPSYPESAGDTIINIKDVDYVVESSRPVPTLPVMEPTEKDLLIGQHIAELIEDGSTIQLGIGGIPNAVAQALYGKRDLGVHTEMFTDSMVDLFNAGVITGAKKTLWKDKMVGTFAYGSKKLYDFIDRNPVCEFQRGRIVNDPYVIGKNYRMVSINTTLQVDLTGQCCSEALGVRHFSGTGGQADTAIGAQMSEGGKSIIALYSTVKNDTISTIVPTLSQGAAVTLSRNDVDYVVTEYGIAPLRGRSIKERVNNLIAVAHPDFRAELKKQAREQMIW
jgi:acyl-CoA hydrolase